MCFSERANSSCDHKYVGTNCKKCGVYDHPQDPAVKTNHYQSYLNCSASKYLKHMRKRQSQQIQFKQINDSTYFLLQTICDKFQYTIQTMALGLYVYAKTCQKQDKDEKFWASAALIVASKGIELDKRVPYLNRYQRYADKGFSQEDYQLAEKTIFQQLNFDLQYSTFISFLHFYLTNGVIFKSDCFHVASLRYVEDDMMQRAKDFLKTGQFLNHNPEKLALGIIKEVRAKFRLDPWKKQLQILSGYSSEDIPSIQKSNILKPLNGLYLKNKDRLCNVSLNTQSINSLQSSLNMTQQKIKSSKKKLEHTLKFHNLKQNSGKVMQQVPFSTLRNQVFSASKYTHNFSMTSSSQKIIPLNSFVSRRA